jgi:hypothetical protein
MNEYITENVSPDSYASIIFEISGKKFDPEIASDL